MNLPQIYITGRDIMKTDKVIIFGLNQCSENHRLTLFTANLNKTLYCYLVAINRFN